MKVLVTGASRGIGKAVAERFLAGAHSVVGFDVLDSGIESAGYRHFKIDVTQPETFPEIGGIEVIVNNAGVQNQNDIDVNLKGAINVAERYISPAIKSVLNVASASAHTGAEFAEYSASKGGLLAYTKNLAARLAKFGATCNSISPGGVLTALNAPVTENPQLWRQVMELTPLKKWATAEEIAEWVYFLTCVNKSATGIDVIIDNGESTCGAKFVWPVGGRWA